MTALQFSVLGYNLRLAHPEYLFGVAAALIVIAWAVVSLVRQRRALDRILPAPVRAAAAPDAAPERPAMRVGLTGLALVLLSVALAQPQCGTHSELAKRFGIDLVIAIDASESMLARDVKPSRLERAKLELSALLDQRKGDRVGLVVFAGDAFTQCPLTNDYAAAKMFLKAIDPPSMPVQGTDIARALEESKDLLVRGERGAKARAIVLLTDGEDTAGSAVQAQLADLKELGIRVITVGIGSSSGEPIPELDKSGAFAGYKKDRAGHTVLSRLDESGLQTIADSTGGRYVRASGGVGVQEIQQELERLDKAEFETRLTVKYDERVQYLAAPAAALVLLGALLRPARRRPRRARVKLDAGGEEASR